MKDFMCVHGDELARCERTFEKALEIMSEDFHTENMKPDLGFVHCAIAHLGAVDIFGDMWFLVTDSTDDDRQYSIECDNIVHGLARAIVHIAEPEWSPDA